MPQAKSEIAVVLAPADSFVDIKAAIRGSSSQLAEVIAADGEAKKLSVVLADGNPRIVSTIWVNFEGSDTPTQKNSVVTAAVAAIGQVTDCIAENKIKTSSEVDYIGAIHAAASVFSPESTSRGVFIYGNGIQTGGVNYAMQRDPLPANQSSIEALIDAFKANSTPIVSGDILSGVRVHWEGLGQVSGTKQDPLNPQTIDTLVNFWLNFIVADGGQVEAGDIEAGDVANASGASTGVIDTSPIKNLPGVCIGPISLYEDDVEFDENLPTFKSKEKALAAAKKVKVQLDKKPCTTAITVTGYVASDTSKTEFEKNPNRGDGLSLLRAQAFAALLRKVGVSSSVEIKPVAGGCPGNDWDEQGNKLESKQKLNRKVVVSQ